MYAVFSTAHGRPSVTLAHLERFFVNVSEGDKNEPGSNSHAFEVEADSSVNIETVAGIIREIFGIRRRLTLI
jgi:hypothetical protein